MSAAPQAPAAPAASAAPAAETAQRVEELLAHLAEHPDPTVQDRAEQLVRALMDFYGAGLARVVELAGKAPAATGALPSLLADDLVTGLLVLHDLHPDGTETRIHRALDRLPGNTLRFAAFDPATGVLRLRPVDPSGCGCAATQAATTQRVEQALSCVAPEVTAVALETEPRPAEPVLVQIGSRPPGGAG